jgi:hypothetical protein
VYVSWCETNPMNGTSELVLRVSTDNGQTFGSLVMLGTNGTIRTVALPLPVLQSKKRDSSRLHSSLIARAQVTQSKEPDRQ